MASAGGRKADDFSQTRWSLVRHVYAPDSQSARDALCELVLRYWYPVYAYVRRCGHAPEIAQDITRAFLQQIGADSKSDNPLGHGRFRDWLLARLNTFLAGDWHDLTGGEVPTMTPPLEDLERRHRDDQAAGGAPELAFQRGFALELLSRGFHTLLTEARQTGHSDMYEALEPYLEHDPLQGQFEEMGERLGIRPLALVLALKRLRQRFRELVRAELADTVASPDEMAAEQQLLFAVLDRGA